jgi:hypothetical protein
MFTQFLLPDVTGLTSLKTEIIVTVFGYYLWLCYCIPYKRLNSWSDRGEIYLY